MINDQQIRSFIAVELPTDLKSAIQQLQVELKPSTNRFINWVAPQAIHITFKFLGNIPMGMVSAITEAIEEASNDTLQFQINTGGLGAFPNLKNPRVLWMGFSGELDKLINLQQQIDNSLLKLGFPKETRLFSPHVTIARVRDGAIALERKLFGELVMTKTLGVNYKIFINSIRLMRSQLKPTGAVYSCLSDILLKKR